MIYDGIPHTEMNDLVAFDSVNEETKGRIGADGIVLFGHVPSFEQI
jgi:hypothetical protein